MKILLVEDNEHLAKSLSYVLEENKYEPTIAYDGETALKICSEQEFDIIILDIMLPGIDGVEVCRQLRIGGSNTPIIMLTAKDTVASKIEGLDGGADDYMTKPFSGPELLAHLRALQRRTGEIEFETVSYLDLSLHLPTHELSCGESVVHLTKKEFEVMRELIINSGTAIPKEKLMKNIWKDSDGSVDNNIRTYISFLRDKLELIESESTIQAISKAGYRIVNRADIES